jgi:hypothetical protein
MAETTITDKNGYIIKNIDLSSFDKLSEEEKIIFEFLRNSFLEILPLEANKNTHSDDSIKYAENFAFINLKAFSVGVNKLIDIKLDLLRKELNLKIDKLSVSTLPITGLIG